MYGQPRVPGGSGMFNRRRSVAEMKRKKAKTKVNKEKKMAKMMNSMVSVVSVKLEGGVDEQRREEGIPTVAASEPHPVFNLEAPHTKQQSNILNYATVPSSLFFHTRRQKPLDTLIQSFSPSSNILVNTSSQSTVSSLSSASPPQFLLMPPQAVFTINISLRAAVNTTGKRACKTNMRKWENSEIQIGNDSLLSSLRKYAIEYWN
ncbi:hypothetical protein E3N88_27124 [Mikania micrantha]|uniref:Uncharacterized protein n=1 Tax=Mikania micrantha TaxID=192012 RepID=A0A5N6MVS4_9ASTR|nr:hypothetical protein E3N88_27124 [Mikania micrantha]